METGITVNGMPATVSGGRFVANHVPLQPGSNAITIVATDANGLTTTATRSVTANLGNYIRISSNIESGTGPLNISLRLDGLFSIINPQVSYSGPVAVTLIPRASSTEYTATLTAEGTYIFTASAVGPDGQTYADSVTITVISRQALETLLKGKWEGMKAKVASGDIQGAGAYFPLASKDMFQALFADTAIDSVSRLNDIKDIEINSITDNYAQGGLIRQDDDGIFSYPLTYSRDEFGLWRIYNF